MQNQQLPLHGHVRELRRRLFRAVAVFLVGGTIGYIFHEPLISLLRQPLHEELYFTSPAGGFNFVMKICMLVGLMLAIPVVVYNLIEFVRPAMNNQISRSHANRTAIFSMVLSILGILFAFYVVVPMSLHFFLGFKGNGIGTLLSASDYLEFVINHLITFIIIFQLPLIMMFIDRIRPLPPKTLLKYDKHVVIGAAALSVVLPFTYDPISQFFVGMPVVVLYNLTIIILFFRHRKLNKHAKQAGTNQPEPTPVEAQPLRMPSFKGMLQSLVAIDAVQLQPAPIMSEQTQPKLILDIQPPRFQQDI